MKKNVIVLGAGLVGKAMAIDLATDFDVTSADFNTNALKDLERFNVKTQILDFADLNKLKTALSPFDLVVGAVPGFLGFQTMKAVIEAGKNMVDISFFSEDPFELDSLAKSKGVTVVMDCGVAPGMSSIIIGHHNQKMKINSTEVLVGGLPVVREWPYEYKAVFSPIDVIEEYVRPARFVQNGAVIIKEALTDPELIRFDEVGTLESWNSDGLRTLIKTMPHIPNMIEKTLRYPGCIEYLRVLRETGFFSKEEINVNGIKVRPVDVTARLLFPLWKLKAGEQEFTVMRIRISGHENNVERTYEYNLLDRTDKISGTLSMARTTGYTCTAVAHLLVTDTYTHPGISAPEFIGESQTNLEFVMNYLQTRGVKYNCTVR